MKEDLDAEDVADTGDYPLIQENFPDFPVSLRVQETKKLLDGEIATERVGPQVPPSGIPLKIALGKKLDNRG